MRFQIKIDFNPEAISKEDMLEQDAFVLRQFRNQFRQSIDQVLSRYAEVESWSVVNDLSPEPYGELEMELSTLYDVDPQTVRVILATAKEREMES